MDLMEEELPAQQRLVEHEPAVWEDKSPVVAAGKQHRRHAVGTADTEHPDRNPAVLDRIIHKKPAVDLPAGRVNHYVDG